MSEQQERIRQQWRAAATRWAEPQEEPVELEGLRERIAGALKAGAQDELNALAEAHLGPAFHHGMVALESLGEEAAESLEGLRRAGLERIQGNDDLLPVGFFEQAQRAALAVCRIEVNGKNAGTGWMIGRRLLLTNNHVLWSAQRAGRAKARFEYELDASGTPKRTTSFDLDPGRVFITDVELDYTLVGVVGRKSGGRVVTDFGTQRISAWPPSKAQPVNIIQHPKGRRKEVVFRNNLIVNFHGSFVHYKADTQKGSSGSPVFDDRWEVVALHHSGAPSAEIDPEAPPEDALAFLDAHGAATQDPEDFVFEANEGVLIRDILADIRRKRFAGAPADESLLATLDEPAILPNLVDREDAGEPDGTPDAGSSASGSAGDGAVTVRAGGDRIRVALNLDVDVNPS